MSELKTIYAYTPDEIEVLGNCAEGDEYYLKSEADKVIAELKEQSHQHYERWFNLNKQYEGWLGKVQRCESAENQLRYNKYKRCLRNAEGCLNKVWYYTEVHDRNASNRMWKWRQRWLELAKKYKPNNEVNNG